MCTTDGGDGQARAQGFALNQTGSLTNFQQVVLAYLKKCGIRYSVTKGGKKQDCTHEPEFQSVHNTNRRDWGESYPPSIGLNHAQPTPEAISRFNTNLLACEGAILKK